MTGLIRLCDYCADNPATLKYGARAVCKSCGDRVSLADEIRISFEPYNPPFNNSIVIRHRQGDRVTRCPFCGSNAYVRALNNIILCRFCGLYAYKFNATSCYTVYLNGKKIDYSEVAPISPFGCPLKVEKIERIKNLLNGVNKNGKI